MDPDHQHFLDQIEKPICPICNMLHEFEFDLLAGLQKEVGDLNTQRVEEMITTTGFCNYHFYELFKMSELQHLSKFLIRYIDDFIENKLVLPELWERDCHLCGVIDKKTRELIRQFLQLYQSEALFRENFLEKGVLCLPHLKQIITEDIPKSHKDKLILRQRKALSETNLNLQSFIKKRYHNSEQEEKRAPIHTISLMVGYHGTRW